MIKKLGLVAAVIAALGIAGCEKDFNYFEKHYLNMAREKYIDTNNGYTCHFQDGYLAGQEGLVKIWVHNADSGELAAIKYAPFEEDSSKLIWKKFDDSKDMGKACIRCEELLKEK